MRNRNWRHLDHTQQHRKAQSVASLRGMLAGAQARHEQQMAVQEEIEGGVRRPRS